MADYYEKDQSYEKAKQMIEKCLLDWPNNSSMRNRFGIILAKQGKYVKALRFFEDTVKTTYFLKSSELT